MNKLELITMARLFVLVFNQILIKKRGIRGVARKLEAMLQDGCMEIYDAIGTMCYLLLSFKNTLGLSNKKSC